MSEQTSSEGSPAPAEARSRGPWWASLRLWTACACVLLVVTVLILPLPIVVRAFILGVLIFSAVFVTVDAGGFGKTFAALTCTLLALYLVYTADRGVSLLLSGSVAGVVLGLGMILLPVLGAWALVREILFGTRIQMMAQQLSDSGDLAEDNLPRTPSGKVDREAAAAEFESFAAAVEQEPENWKAWFNLACMYDAVGERKRARAAMRNAWSLRSGGAAKEMR
ncbi:tetratricopeptide repeat protein [uncultured Rothia sp.]|uniref:tetratricopeptide repeat protein n=1 Tax=uncultured Rothia sp. TaxID=316088 RepID=UPI0025F6B19C|nr:tetratricopeptide repeat protein [uncultured Rothia sp.]